MALRLGIQYLWLETDGQEVVKLWQEGVHIQYCDSLGDKEVEL
jgi:hypothetical protein